MNSRISMSGLWKCVESSRTLEDDPGSSPEEMDVPIKVDEELYFEGN